MGISFMVKGSGWARFHQLYCLGPLPWGMGMLDLAVFTQSLGLSGRLLSFVQKAAAIKRAYPAAPSSASSGLRGSLGIRSGK